jgi:hypothetical protein
MLTALLLLLAGQLGAVASAQAATCRRAEAAGAVGAAPESAAPAAAIRLTDEHRHDAGAPSGEAPALASPCVSAAALPGRRADVPLHPGRTLPSSAWAESPPRDLLLSGFFRPPRPG